MGQLGLLGMMFLEALDLTNTPLSPLSQGKQDRRELGSSEPTRKSDPGLTASDQRLHKIEQACGEECCNSGCLG